MLGHVMSGEIRFYMLIQVRPDYVRLLQVRLCNVK